MIHHYVDDLARGRSRLCLATDCAVIVAAASMAGRERNATAIACGLALLVWLVVARTLRQYDIWKGYRGRGRLSRFRPGEVLNDLALTGVLLAAVCSVLLVTQGLFGIPLRLDLRAFVIVLVPVVLALRLMWIGVLFLRNREKERVVVVGTGALGRMTGVELRERAMGRALVGYLRLPHDREARKLPAPLLGDAESLATLLQTSAISEVYIAASATRQGAAMQQVIDVCESYGVPFALPLHDFRLNRARPVNGGALKDGFIHFVNFQPKPLQMLMKRLFDIVASATLLWLLAPLLLFVAVLVKITSRGPALFRQPRAGMHGQEFSMLKFRSMVIDAEKRKATLLGENDLSGPVFKMRRDPRVTPLGRWLRRFSIDELPQLVNVLRGDMSIVGPRPPLPSEVSKYEPWQHRRLSVRPGLTCVWQVSGRNNVQFEDWMYLDMQYIDNWNLVRDFDLILKTVPVVLSGRGAS